LPSETVELINKLIGLESLQEMGPLLIFAFVFGIFSLDLPEEVGHWIDFLNRMSRNEIGIREILGFGLFSNTNNYVLDYYGKKASNIVRYMSPDQNFQTLYRLLTGERLPTQKSSQWSTILSQNIDLKTIMSYDSIDLSFFQDIEYYMTLFTTYHRSTGHLAKGLSLNVSKVEAFISKFSSNIGNVIAKDIADVLELSLYPFEKRAHKISTIYNGKNISNMNVLRIIPFEDQNSYSAFYRDLKYILSDEKISFSMVFQFFQHMISFFSNLFQSLGVSFAYMFSSFIGFPLRVILSEEYGNLTQRCDYFIRFLRGVGYGITKRNIINNWQNFKGNGWKIKTYINEEYPDSNIHRFAQFFVAAGENRSILSFINRFYDYQLTDMLSVISNFTSHLSNPDSFVSDLIKDISTIFEYPEFSDLCELWRDYVEKITNFDSPISRIPFFQSLGINESSLIEFQRRVKVFLKNPNSDGLIYRSQFIIRLSTIIDNSTSIYDFFQQMFNLTIYPYVQSFQPVIEKFVLLGYLNLDSFPLQYRDEIQMFFLKVGEINSILKRSRLTIHEVFSILAPDLLDPWILFKNITHRMKEDGIGISQTYLDIIPEEFLNFSIILPRIANLSHLSLLNIIKCFDQGNSSASFYKIFCIDSLYEYLETLNISIRKGELKLKHISILFHPRSVFMLLARAIDEFFSTNKYNFRYILQSLTYIDFSPIIDSFYMVSKAIDDDSINSTTLIQAARLLSTFVVDEPIIIPPITPPVQNLDRTHVPLIVITSVTTISILIYLILKKWVFKLKPKIDDECKLM